MRKWIFYIAAVFIAVTLIDTLLLPPINIPSIDNLVFPFALLAIVWEYRRHKIFRWSLLIALLLVGSSIASNYVNEGITIKEIIWSIRWLKLLTLAWCAYFVRSENRFLFDSFLVISFLGAVLLNALQLMEFTEVVRLYAPKNEWFEFLDQTLVDARVFGALNNSNDNAVVMGLLGLYFFQTRVQRWQIFLAMSLVIVILSQSRTVFLAMLFVVAAIQIINLWKHNKKAAGLSILGVIVVFVGVGFLKLKNLDSLMNGSAFSSNSFVKRLDNVQSAYHQNTDSMIFGHGKISNMIDVIGAHIDNEIAGVYLEYGLVGFIVFAVLVLFLFGIAFKKKDFFLVGMLVFMLICGLTNLTFTGRDIGTLFFVLFAGAIALAPNGLNAIKDNNSQKKD